MKHLKLGIYSFDIDTNKLGLVSNTPKSFTRDELPDNLKPLFDIIYNASNRSLSKSVFISLHDDNNTIHYSGFVKQSNSHLSLTSSDGDIIDFATDVNDKIVLVYHEF